MADDTPMMRQYYEIKQQHPDTLLFFRLGDFYEMFGDDAKLAAKELELTLTTRDRGKEKSEQTPMCGVPYHAADSYICRLVSRGYRIAICEQMENPAEAKGIVRREITRIITPGTLTDSSMLDEQKNNFFGCVYTEKDTYALAFCDVSTGAFLVCCVEDEDKMTDELAKFSPAEVLLSGDATQELAQKIRGRFSCCLQFGEAQDEETSLAALREQFGTLPEELPSCAVGAAGGLLEILHTDLRSALPHVSRLQYYDTQTYMGLDWSARRNLELVQTMRTGERRGSLLWVMDRTLTPMGSRLLRSWMDRPLTDPVQITRRLNSVETLFSDTVRLQEFRAALREVCDLERVIARIAAGACSARDLRQLANGLRSLPRLEPLLAPFTSGLLGGLKGKFDALGDIREKIDAIIVDEPPFTVREGNIIREGYNKDIDDVRRFAGEQTDLLPEIEQEEKRRTGIKNLRVGYNRSFGYYIEVAKSQTGLVPPEYIRRQTTVNGERYITHKLRMLELNILNAKDRIMQQEYEIFCALRQEVAEQVSRVLATANKVALLDVLCSMAALALENNYCRPEVDASGALQIVAGRHPVVEKTVAGTLFVPNDTEFSPKGCRTAVITGPNMAGKSTYMRQVALIVLMAQMGSFVPAQRAHIGVVDKLFTRIGASDDLAAGQSTFMVEMQEVAEILKNATPKSLLIFDEIGRGTATYDGMAIARAVLEYVSDPKILGAKTLFATHYHELTVLDRTLPCVENFTVCVKKRGEEMIFLRKIVKGVANRSYGVEVAQLAGLPQKAVTRAKALLRELEKGGAVLPAPVQEAPSDQVSMQDMTAAAIAEKLAQMNVETMTPIEAMNALYGLKQML